jgi:hypothetical protein
MEKKEILLPTKRYFKAEEQDLNLNVKLENDETLLRQGDKDIVLNLADLFNEERNKSINYKIYGKIKMVFRNMYSGNTNYTPLLRNLYLIGDGTSEFTTDSSVGFVPYNEFAFLRNDVVREKTIPTTGSTLGYQTVVPNISLDTGVPFGRYTGHTTMSSLDAPYKNWNLYLSYVDSHDTGFTMNYTLSGGTNYNFVSGNGIPFRVTTGDTYVTLTSPVEHGLSSGEHLILSATTLTTHFWVSGITYSKDNIIHYSNKIYTSKSNSNLNNEPPTTGSTYWKLVTNWSSTETYDINNLVFYSGSTYKSLTISNLNNTPPVTGTTSSWVRTSNRQYYTLPITSDTEKYRIFNIDNVGNQIYNSEKYVINILRSEFSSGTILDSVVFGRRCTDVNDITGTTSTYYVHKHKTLTTIDDYILDKVGFENSIWEDERKILFENTLQENDVLVERNRQEALLFDFKNTFSLSGITNNLGYTPTEVYVTTIFKNSNGLFDYPPKVGFKFNFHNSWVDNQFTGNTETSITKSGFTSNYGTTGFTSGNKLDKGTVLTGAFVEYNRKELKERIISETYHKFSHLNTVGGVQIFNHGQDQNSFYSLASPSNPVGYYYQPHYRVKLRELSPYIETSKLDATQPNTLINLPENAIYDQKEKLWKWRDLYDHGFIDQEGNGTNFPFMNNTHYVTKNINFYLRNEKSYTNKDDGLNGFNNYQNKTNC